MSTPTRIKIYWRNGAYYVSEPNFGSQTVVLAREYDSLLAERDKAMKALHDLTPGGSEYFDDIERCVTTVRHTRDSLMKQFVSERKRTQVLEAENTRLREALETISKARLASADSLLRIADLALAAGKGTSPDLSADPAAYDRIADRELGPAAGKGETK